MVLVLFASPMFLLPFVALAMAPPTSFDAVLGKGKVTFAEGDRIALDVRVWGHEAGRPQYLASEAEGPLVWTVGDKAAVRGQVELLGLMEGMKAGGVRLIRLGVLETPDKEPFFGVKREIDTVWEVSLYRIDKKGIQPVIEIETLNAGTGDVAADGKTVEIHYTGTFVNGKKFDSSRDRNQTFSFQLGAGRVIKGFDMGVVGMKVGERRKVTIPAELGYGSRDNGPIPANSTLVFDIELVSVK